MAGICDRCTEKTSQLINIAHLPEMAPVMHLAYRQVCPDCYDDLLAEAKEDAGGENLSEDEPYVEVEIPARVSGNTSHLDAFSDEMTIEEITKSGLLVRTSRDLDPGALLNVVVPSYALEFAAIVDEVSAESDHNLVDLKLVEQSDGWDRLWRDYSSGDEE